MLCYARFGTICKFKKREKHPWKSATFRKVAGFSKVNSGKFPIPKTKLLTHFLPTLHFYTPGNRRKPDLFRRYRKEYWR